MAEFKTYQVAAGWLESVAGALREAKVDVLVPCEEDGCVDLRSNQGLQALPQGYLNTVLPVKRVLMPASEVLLEYERQSSDITLASPQEPAPETVVIGCRPCDAAALEMLDAVFEWDYEDVPYAERRRRTTIVSFACTEAHPTCFCTSVGGSPHNSAGSDVLVYSKSDGGALMQVLTEKGAAFIGKLGPAAEPTDAGPPAPPDVPEKFDTKKIKAWLDENFESDFWVDVSLRCLGCGACSYVCPTCHCFDIVDESIWNRGQRRRNWDCCSFALFTKHASGHNPRPVQSARCRQRVMHKFKYFPERFGRVACVGCGRCVRTCGVGQGLVSILAAMDKK